VEGRVPGTRPVNQQHMQFCASPEWQALVVETILPVALAGVDLGDDALEIGPGPGFTTDVLQTMTGHLTAVEIDPVLAGALTSRVDTAKVTVVLGDATALEFPDASFSGAASFHMLHHIPTTEAQNSAFRELARVLRPGAVLVAADSGYRADTVLFHDGDTYNPIEPDDLPGRLSAAGFSDVMVREYELGWVCTARAT
jgi:SAM-dependent methyltransferase